MTAAAKRVVDVVFCPTCESPALPSSTVCGECGERLVPPTPFGPPPLAKIPRCKQPAGDGRPCGVCAVCTIALYDSGAAL